MSRGLIFWVLMLIWFVFSLAVYGGFIGGPYGLAGTRLLDFILFLLLGWQVYGPPVRA
jgi:hypothetical protein